MIFNFNELGDAELIVDAIYKGGTAGNVSDDPLSKLFPKLGNMSGFRKVKRKDNSNKLAYVVLYTSMEEFEWPDYLDVETGIFRYYGDNRNAGNNITATKQGGNKLLEEVFKVLNSGNDLSDIPPFFIFKKVKDQGRSVQFLGLAAPGNPSISPDKDLVAFWRTVDGNRFQNYESYFTILDTKDHPIDKEWLESLIYNHDNNLEKAPSAWVNFIKKGRNGIKALKSPRVFKVPSKYDQLQSSVDGKKCLSIIRKHYQKNPTGFEACAVRIAQMMDSNFETFSLTRPWRDGGRDAIGQYVISSGCQANFPLKMDCALEAKCYGENNAVKVKQMSRLISRIRYRQFGILVTTSYVADQAYKEVAEDGHPILIVTAADIAYILNRNMLDSNNIDAWLTSIDENISERVNII